MATVTLPTITAGTTAADAINDVLYDGPANSMRAINGHLNSSNLSGTITSEHIREQALANGKMVAATGVLDCPAEAYSRSADDALGVKPIPGASIEFYLPYDASVVLITWNIGAGNTIRVGGVQLVLAQMRLHIDGDSQSGFKRRVPGDRANDNRREGDLIKDQNFRYSGHKTVLGMTKGFHSASLRLFVGTGPNSGDLVRLRVRDMKVIWFK